MQLDTSKIRNLRQSRAWTQQQLADICGLSLRTIQRVELHGSASLETGRSLASAFEIDYSMLLVAAHEDGAGSDVGRDPSPLPNALAIGVGTFSCGVAVGALAMLVIQ